MKSKFLFILPALLFYVSISAQKNFLAGEITKNDGTIVVGQIDYKEWKINPIDITFKNSDSGKEQIFGLKDLLGFSITDKKEFYKKAVVAINTDYVNEYNLQEYQSLKDAYAYSNSKIITDSVFLLTLVKGHSSLYFLLDDKRKKHFFIQKQNDSIKELDYHLFLISTDGTKNIYKTKDFVLQIQSLFNDCPTFQIDVESIKYTEKDLTKAVQSYNSCKGGNFYIKKADKTTNQFYVFGGANYPVTTISDYKVIMLSGGGTLSSVFGLGSDFGISRNREKWGVGIEIYDQQLTSNVSYAGDNGPTNYNLDINYLRFNAHFRYLLLSGKINPYLKFGFGLALSLKTATTVTETNIYNRPVLQDIQYRNTEKFIFTAIGIKMNKFYVEGRYEIGENINPFIYNRASTNYLGLCVGYVFLKK